MAKLFLTKKEKLALREFKKETFEGLKGKVLGLKLFGSKARGNFKKESDIDILMVVKERRPKIVKFVYHMATKILLKYGIYLSIKIIEREELERGLKVQFPFYLVIQKEGINLWSLK